MSVFRHSIVFFLVWAVMPVSFASLIYHYDPSSVELTGILEMQTFPGPPNYESIADGDEIEKAWFLRLNEPIDVLANNPVTDLGWKTERNVKILQMAVHPSRDKDIWKKMTVGKTIYVKGKLFTQLTGHHHSRVLLDVDSIGEVK